MPSVFLDGININYELSGEGKALIFVHGLISRGKGWTNQIAEFSKRYKVIAPDMRGHGKSFKSLKKEDYEISKLTSDLYQLLSYLNVSRCFMVGHSWGGKIVMQFTVEHPNMISGIVLISTIGENPEEAISKKAQKIMNEESKKAGWGKAFLYAMETDPSVATFYNLKPEKLEKMRQKLISDDSKAFKYAWKAVADAPSPLSRLSKLGIPCLLICGEKDLSGMIDASQEIHGLLPYSELLIVEGVRHFPQDDSPAIVNEAISKFLNKLDW